MKKIIIVLIIAMTGTSAYSKTPEDSCKNLDSKLVKKAIFENLKRDIIFFGFFCQDGRDCPANNNGYSEKYLSIFNESEKKSKLILRVANSGLNSKKIFCDVKFQLIYPLNEKLAQDSDYLTFPMSLIVDRGAVTIVPDSWYKLNTGPSRSINNVINRISSDYAESLRRTCLLRRCLPFSAMNDWYERIPEEMYYQYFKDNYGR